MWLDDKGISHEGDPPRDHQMFGGRYYQLTSVETLADLERSADRAPFPVH